jgi:hypothetical protein
MNAVLLPLEAISTPIDWPDPETGLEDSLFCSRDGCVCRAAALRTGAGGVAQRGRRTPLRAAYGPAYLCTCSHYWTQIHPDLGFDDDVREMLDQHEELASLLLKDPEAAHSDMGVRLLNELQLLRDLNERRELEKAKEALEVELAHVSRVAMMGELTASIAHEVLRHSPPSPPMPTRASSGSQAVPPNLDRARACLDRIARDGKQAGEVIGRSVRW